MKGDSQQLQFNHYCGLFIISLNFACRDFNLKLKIVCCHSILGKIRTAQLAILPLMSRHMMVCRDIFKLWEDK